MANANAGQQIPISMNTTWQYANASVACDGNGDFGVKPMRCATRPIRAIFGTSTHGGMTPTATRWMPRSR